MGLADQRASAKLFVFGQVRVGEQPCHFGGAGHGRKRLTEFREGHEQAARHAGIDSGGAGEGEGEFTFWPAFAVIDVSAGWRRVLFESHGGGVDEVCDGGLVGSNKRDPALALAACLAAAQLLGERGAGRACGPVEMWRRAQRIRARLCRIARKVNGCAMRQGRGGSGDGVLRALPGEVRDSAVGRDYLVARHEQGGRRDLEQGRGGRRGAVGRGEEG